VLKVGSYIRFNENFFRFYMGVSSPFFKKTHKIVAINDVYDRKQYLIKCPINIGQGDGFWRAFDHYILEVSNKEWEENCNCSWNHCRFKAESTNAT
jgi:hypothetical protein